MSMGMVGLLTSHPDVWSVLSSKLTITVESTQDMVDRVNGKAKAGVKTATVLPELAGKKTIEIRPIDFLRKIGTLTVPARHSMAQLSASWAAIRYCWSIEPAPSGKKAPFKLSRDARSLDFHQKSLLSDEFGVGFAGLVLERLLGAPNSLDTSAVLTEKGPKKPLQGKLKTRRQPDYVMWGKSTPYYVVECKGCQSSSAHSVSQIASGLAQLDSLRLKPGKRAVVKIVVAARMLQNSTSILVVDPEDSEEEPAGTPIKRDKRAKQWVIENDEQFARLAWVGHEAQLFRFIGQYSEADQLALQLPVRPDLKSEFTRPNELTIEKQWNGSTFLGYSSSVLPELGKNWPRLFRGIDADLLETLRSGKDPDAIQEQLNSRQGRALSEQPNISIGADGTCYALEFE